VAKGEQDVKLGSNLSTDRLARGAIRIYGNRHSRGGHSEDLLLHLFGALLGFTGGPHGPKGLAKVDLAGQVVATPPASRTRRTENIIGESVLRGSRRRGIDVRSQVLVPMNSGGPGSWRECLVDAMKVRAARSGFIPMKKHFQQFAHLCAERMGSYKAFIGGVTVILAWLAAGPFLAYSDTWQLVINTATTVITFLMVFLIQSTQNRDTKEIQLKLDELLRAVDAARTRLVRLEDLSDEELEKLREEFGRLAASSPRQ